MMNTRPSRQKRCDAEKESSHRTFTRRLTAMSTDAPPPPRAPRAAKRNPAVELYVFCTCAVGLILYGYAAGASSVMLGSSKQFTRDFNVDGDVDVLGALVACTSVGALIGAFIAVAPVRGVALADAYGRISLMRAGAGCYVAGGALGALTPGAATSWVDASTFTPFKCSAKFGVYWFGATRVVYGVGMSLCYQATAVYVAEMSSQRSRGFYLPMIAVMTMVGDLAGNFVGLALERASGSWRMLAALPVPFASAYAYYVGKCPDSPRWLILNATNASKNDSSAMRATTNLVYDDDSYDNMADVDLRRARETLAVLRSTSADASFSISDTCFRGRRGGMLGVLENPEVPDAMTREEIERELDDILAVVKASADTANRNVCATLNQTGTRRAMYVAFGLSMMSMLSGAPALTYFMKHIFEMTGHTPIRATSLTTGLAFVRLLVTLFVAIWLETFGRRKMLLIGTSIQLLATTILTFIFDGLKWIETPAVSFQVLQGSLASAADFAIFANAVGFHIGFWALAWTVSNELSPLRSRATIVALNAVFSWILSIITVRFLPAMMASPGIGATFGFCAGSLFLTVIFIYFYVPETKGRSLEEVEMIVAKAASLRDVVREMNIHSATSTSTTSSKTRAAIRRRSEASPLLVDP